MLDKQLPQNWCAVDWSPPAHTCIHTHTHTFMCWYMTHTHAYNKFMFGRHATCHTHTCTHMMSDSYTQCDHTYTHTCIHTHTSCDTHTQNTHVTYTHIHTHTHTHTYTYTHTCTHMVWKHTQHIYTHACCVDGHTFTYTHTHTHTHTHIHICIYTHTEIYTHKHHIGLCNYPWTSPYEPISPYWPYLLQFWSYKADLGLKMLCGVRGTLWWPQGEEILLFDLSGLQRSP
jgi:hypothetical protein